ncbi:MAG: hypothetical protein WCX46_02830 [Candidatus Paceibacterota bacterium]
MKKIWIYVVVIIIVIIAIVLMVNGSTKESFVAEDNAVIIADQKPSENVTVHYVKLKKAGYVNVVEVSNEGIKETIGTSELLPAGEYFDVLVKTSRPTRHGHRIVGELIIDNGDGIFNVEEDPAVLDDTLENNIEAEAGISDDASEEIDLVLEAEADGFTVEEENIDDILNEDETFDENMIQDEIIDEDMDVLEDENMIEEENTIDNDTEIIFEETNDTVVNPENVNLAE